MAASTSKSYDYHFNPLIPPVRTLKTFAELPVAIIVIALLHTVDTILFLLNLIALPISPLVPVPSTSEWQLTDKIFAAIMGGIGWGWVTDEEIAALTGKNDYQPPKDGDSRAPCPGINSLANAGYIKRDGKHISLSALALGLRRHYDLSPTICFQLTLSVAFMTQQSGNHKEWMNLSDIGNPNYIEHDASLTRDDRTIQPDQGKPNAPLIDWLLSFAVPTKTSPVPILTYTNSAKALYERRRFCSSQDSPEKIRNTQFTLTALQNIFGSGNAAIAIMCFGGRVDWLNTWLKEEKFPYDQGWTPHNRPEDWLPRGLFGITFVRHGFHIGWIENLIGAVEPNTQIYDSYSNGAAKAIKKEL